jgi:hypothetical protein
MGVDFSFFLSWVIRTRGSQRPGPDGDTGQGDAAVSMRVQFHWGRAALRLPRCQRSLRAPLLHAACTADKQSPAGQRHEWPAHTGAEGQPETLALSPVAIATALHRASLGTMPGRSKPSCCALTPAEPPTTLPACMQKTLARTGSQHTGPLCPLWAAQRTQARVCSFSLKHRLGSLWFQSAGRGSWEGWAPRQAARPREALRLLR